MNTVRELYEKYIDCFCDIAVKHCQDPHKLFWHQGEVKFIDDHGLYLELKSSELITIPLTEIVKIKVVG